MRTTRCVAGFCLCMLQLFAARTSAVPYPMEQTFDGGLTAWSPSGTWALTTAKSRSPSQSVTDSPGTYYTNNTDSALTLASSFDLSSATNPAIRFYHQSALEQDYDFGHVEISTNGGADWIATPLASYTGNRGIWTREQLDLSDYAGESDVRIRFRIETDYSVIMDGWYLDDIRIDEAPEPATGLYATNIMTTSLELRWTPSVSPDVAGYRVYRSLRPRAENGDVSLIGEISGATSSNVVDITVNPKTTYYYWLVTANAKDMESTGAEISATTPSGMDYPFLDNGEGGPNTWVAEAPWALSDEDAASPTHAWSDSPGTDYANSINKSLTITAPLDLRGTANPVLCFRHRHDFIGGDSGNAEVSANGGTDWTALGTYTGNSAGTWRHQRYSLNAYTNSAAVLVRFRLTSDTATTADGWHIDDICVAPSPSVINAPIISDIEAHAMRLTWAASTDPLFSHYAIFRSTVTGVGINSTWVTNLYDAGIHNSIDTTCA